MLSDIPVQTDPRILVDFRTADDAGVYAWEGGPALVQTVDFFTPIVDDPYIFGQIAAANALSDIYAMGARPLTALAIAAFPREGIEEGVIKAVFRGGFDKLQEAGVALLGGHTVQDQEIKFGYAVTGAVEPSRMLTNAGARAGDVLLLTKPLGTGILSTATKFGRSTTNLTNHGIRVMRTLNSHAAHILSEPRFMSPRAAHACTDVTGFGLLGHLTEVAIASAVTLVIVATQVPLLDGILDIAQANRSGGLSTNRAHFGAGVTFEPLVSPEMQDVLFDPQTSGGLLVSLRHDVADAVLDALHAAGVDASRIGRVVPQETVRVRVE